jgi:protein phosphatase 1L
MMDAGVAESKGKRSYMEDRHIIANKLPTFSSFALFGVFDGHGGSKTAESIKELLVPTVETHIHKGKLTTITDAEKRANAMKVVLHNSLLEVDLLFGSIFPKDEKGGSTAIVALVWVGQPPILALANVGDCRGLLVHDDGNFDVLSIDHKPSLPSERARIESLGGKVLHEPNNVCRVEGVLAVSRAIGDFPLRPYVIPDPDFTLTTLQPNHCAIVLASDGVWDVMENVECAQQVRLTLAKLRSPSQAAHEVVRVVTQRGGIDNMTCMVISLN